MNDEEAAEVLALDAEISNKVLEFFAVDEEGWSPLLHIADHLTKANTAQEAGDAQTLVKEFGKAVQELMESDEAFRAFSIRHLLPLMLKSRRMTNHVNEHLKDLLGPVGFEGVQVISLQDLLSRLQPDSQSQEHGPSDPPTGQYL